MKLTKGCPKHGQEMDEMWLKLGNKYAEARRMLKKEHKKNESRDIQRIVKK